MIHIRYLLQMLFQCLICFNVLMDVTPHLPFNKFCTTFVKLLSGSSNLFSMEFQSNVKLKRACVNLNANFCLASWSSPYFTISIYFVVNEHHCFITVNQLGFKKCNWKLFLSEKTVCIIFYEFIYHFKLSVNQNEFDNFLNWDNRYVLYQLL